MNKGTTMGVLMIAVATAMMLGVFTAIPPALATFVSAVLMGYMAYIRYQVGERVGFISTSAVAGLFLTNTISSIVSASLLPLTVILLVVAVTGAVHNLASGFGIIGD